MMTTNTTAAPSRTLAQQIKDWLVARACNIVFGMEDGTVSIFGLVFYTEPCSSHSASASTSSS